jgi:hypothetical protein
MCCRIIPHQARSLGTPSRCQSLLEKLQCKLDVIDRHKPCRVYGRHIFLKSLIDKTKTVGSSKDSATNSALARTIFQTHSKIYEDLHRLSKARFDSEARQHNTDVLSHLARERALVRDRMRDAVDSARQRREVHGDPVHMSTFKFTLEDLNDMSSMMQTPKYRNLRLATAPSPSQLAPQRPTEQIIRALERIEKTFDVPGTAFGHWCRQLCCNRDLFHGVGLSTAGGDEVYFMLYAKQNEYVARFLVLKEREWVYPSSDDIDDGVRPWHRQDYTYLDCKTVTDRELPFNDDSEIVVHPRMVFVDDVVASNHPSKPFDVFTMHHPATSRAAPAKAERGAHRWSLREEARAALLADNPWLDEEDLPGCKSGKRGGSGGCGGGHGDPKRPPVVPEHDADGADELLVREAVDVEAVGEELAALRKERADEFANDDFFWTKVRGGGWTFEHTGVVGDYAAAYARGGIALEWCNGWAYPKQASFSYNLYGVENAHILSREYCRRSKHFFMMWLNSPNDLFTFSDLDLKSYNDSGEFLEMMCAVHIESPTFVRGRELQDCFPTCEA